MDLKKQILVALGLDKDEDVNMAWQAKAEDGTIFVSTADELAEGVDVSVLTEDGTTILLPVGEYRTDEGVTFRVDEEGIVAEVLGTEEVEEVEEVVEEEMSEELEVEDDAFERLVERVQNLEDAIADLKEDKVEATEEVEELAEETEEEEEIRGTTPKSIKTTEVVEFTVEELKAENERLKTELAAQPAAQPLNTSKFSEAKTTLSKKQIKGMTSQDRFLYNLNN